MSYVGDSSLPPTEHTDTHGASTRALKRKDDGNGKQRELAFKVTHVFSTLFLLWLIVVHAVGLIFFTRGFLLNRLILEHQSQCDVLPNGHKSTSENGCWHPKSFDRAVVIIIDALRYDFAVPFTPSRSTASPQVYHDNLPLLHRLASSQPEHALLRPFIADPPTSTAQRLKALTAGNLPTFIDIGSSFGGGATVEDDILVQLNKTGKTVVHLGDNTWHELFPGYFDANLSRPYDSFNVWDLHTVDNGVIEHLMPLILQEDANKWDICFAHFLGVDHAGHRYGPDHPAMADKLRQMNQVLAEVVDSIDEDTLLVVMGDHGMDAKGDHGGESDDEVESTLWMYSKRRHFGRLHPAHRFPPTTAKDRPVQQIDFVPTLAFLLGLPVPFNNLGSPIPEAFIGPDNADWQNLATVSALTFEQMERYQTEYVRSRDLEYGFEQNKTRHRFREASRVAGATRSAAQWQAMHQLYTQTYSDTIGMFRRLWTKFNLVDMSAGIVLSAVHFLALFAFYRSSGPDTAEHLPHWLRYLSLTSAIGALGGAVIPAVLGFPGSISSAAYGGALVSTGYVLLSSLQHFHVSNPFQSSLWGWFAFFVTVSQAAGFASNSYTIHEDTILTFFLTTFGVLACMSSCRQPVQSDRVLGVYHAVLFVALTRLASYSRLCREEQMPGCMSSFYASQTSSTSASWHIGISFMVALVLPEIIKAFYRGTASYVATAGFWIGFIFRSGLLLVAVYWTIDAADNGNWVTDLLSESTLKTMGITVARCAVAVALPVGLPYFVWAKPCLDISIKSAEQSTSANKEDQPRQQVTILGYANSFGTRYYLIMPVMVLIMTLLLPPMGQFSMAILTWQILCLLEILDTNKLTVDTVSTESSSIGPVVLAMLGSFHFFKTGHQAVLSSIQWNSAFIPFRQLTYPWAPILVAFNTFGAQIICAAAVPLTVLWKRPISKDGLRGIWSDVMKASMAHLLYYALIQLATTMWAGHLRRHLMLYRVFMPRFLMGSIVLVVVELVVLAVSLPAVRVSSQSVADVFGY